MAAGRRICENARWLMLSLGPKAALLVGLLLMTLLAGIAPSTLNRLEFLNPVVTAYGATQSQPVPTAAPGQAFLAGFKGSSQHVLAGVRVAVR